MKAITLDTAISKAIDEIKLISEATEEEIKTSIVSGIESIKSTPPESDDQKNALIAIGYL